MLALIRQRNTHPAFGGSFTLEAGDADHRLTMQWAHGEHTARLQVDFAALTHRLTFSG